MEAKSYPCPNCGAPMEFDSDLQKMRCSHCENVMSVDDLKARFEEANQMYESAGDENKEEDHVYGEFQQENQTGTFKVYRCKGCGAEILTDDNTAATFCSFCGRPSLMEDRLSGELLPSYVIPFKYKKEQAVDIYKKWARKGMLTPHTLRSNATIEKITGMYVPFWLYDYDAEMQMSAKCTRTRHQIKGDYEYIYTDHYMVDRDVETEYLKIPADASERMPDDTMDKLEPFNYGELEQFEMPYLSGYYAEKHNYDSDQMAPRVEKRVKDYIYSATMSTIVGYSSVIPISQQTRLGRKMAKYAILPVWVLNYSYKGKEHMFTLNGQTGKIVADRPVSVQKGIGWFAGITTVAFGILFAIGRFLV